MTLTRKQFDLLVALADSAAPITQRMLEKSTSYSLGTINKVIKELTEYGYVNNDNIMEQVKKAPSDGYTVVSTIDFNIQTIVEKWIIKRIDLVVCVSNAAADFIAEKYGIQLHTVKRWRDEYLKHGEDSFKNGFSRKPQKSERERQLEKENEALRLEVEILKKAAAFLANVK